MSESSFNSTGTLPPGDSSQGTQVPGNPSGATPVPALMQNSYASIETARVFLTEWDDFALMLALQTASQIVRDYLGIEYLQQITTEVYTQNNIFHKILLNRGPVNSIVAIQILTVNRQNIRAILAPQSYYFDSKFLNIVDIISTGNVGFEDFSCGPTPIAVNYDAGYVVTPTTNYTMMPQAIQLATIYTAKALLMARTADFNVSGENAAGAYSMQYLVNSVGNIPPTAQIMLQPYRRTAVY